MSNKWTLALGPGVTSERIPETCQEKLTDCRFQGRKLGNSWKTGGNKPRSLLGRSARHRRSSRRSQCSLAKPRREFPGLSLRLAQLTPAGVGDALVQRASEQLEQDLRQEGLSKEAVANAERDRARLRGVVLIVDVVLTLAVIMSTGFARATALCLKVVERSPSLAVRYTLAPRPIPMHSTPAEDALDLLPYFGSLRPNERVRIASRIRLVQLEKGSSFALVDPVLVMVVEGELALVRDADRASLFPGDSVGDAEVLGGKGNFATLTARVPSLLGVLDRSSLDATLEEFPVIALPWVAELGRELRWRNDVLREILLARSTGLSATQLQPILRRHQLRLRRARHHPVHRIGALLGRVLFTEPSRRPAFWSFVGWFPLWSARGPWWR